MRFGTNLSLIAGMASEFDLPSEAVALAREIENKAGALDEQDLFAVLGLTRACTQEQILWAHETLTRWFHPGRLKRLGLWRLRRMVRRIQEQLDYALWILGDETSRRAYEAQMDSSDEIEIAA
jgi:hypothetical protein